MTGVEHTDGRRRAPHARRPTSSSAPPTCTTSRPRCCRADLQTYPRAVVAPRTPGPGAVLAMLGRRGRAAAARPPLAVLHRGLGRELRRHLRSATTRGPGPASVYVCKPSASDPTVAPAGLREPLRPGPGARPTRPSARGGDDGRGPARGAGGDAAIDQVAAWAGRPGPARPRRGAPHGRARATSPRTYNSWRGGALGLEHTLRQSAFLRAGQRRRRKVDGLLYAGAGTVPGVGTADVPDQRRARPQAADAATGPSLPVSRMSLPHWAYVAMLAFCLAGTLPLVPAFRLPGAAAAAAAAAHRSSRPGRRSWSGTCTPPTCGHWWFDADQTLPWRVAGLPLEEIAFFVVIPLVAVLTYEAVRVVRRPGAAARGRRPRREVR